MKTNTNKTLTRAQAASMSRKIKDAKRSNVGGFTFNMSSEFFNVERLGMIDKEKAVNLLKGGDVILGNEKFDNSSKMFSLVKRFDGGIYLSINGEEDEHGWLYEAISVFNYYTLDVESIDEAIAACSVMNSMYGLYGHQCWLKYGAAKMAITLGASEEEAFWIAHYISYQQYMLLTSEEVQVSSVQDLWDVLRIDNDVSIRLYNDLFYITKDGPVSVSILFSYGEDLLNKYEESTKEDNKKYIDKCFYEEMYINLYKKGYWEKDAYNDLTISLIKQGKNRLAKLEWDIYSRNILESISATGVDKNKFDLLVPKSDRSIDEFFCVLKNKEFKSFVKSYNGKFVNLVDAMQKMLTSKGVKVEISTIHIDYLNLNIPGCFDALIGNLQNLKGRTVKFGVPPSIIDRFAKSNFENLGQFKAIVDSGLDPDEKTGPSVLLGSIKGASVEEMDMWVLPKSDYRNLVIGDSTGCCQRIGGAGEDVCIEGWTDPYSVNVVFGSRPKDEFHAHTWVWETYHGDIVLDSIEGRSFVDYTIVAGLVLELVQQMKKKGVKVFIGDTSYGLTRDIVSYFKKRALVSEAICPESIVEYSYMDTEPGDKCWLIKV